MKTLCLLAMLSLTFPTVACSKDKPKSGPMESLSPRPGKPAKAAAAGVTRTAPTRNARPQDPSGTLPYTSKEVGFEVEAGNPKSRLACTLSEPKGTGKRPAVFVVSGSGAQDRHGSMYGHQPYKVLADQLVRAGVAVMRCDDRGLGGSKGKITTQTLDEKAFDVVAVVRFLRGLATIDDAKVGVVGHSEGALVGAMAAVKSQSVAFVVMLSGIGATGRETLRAQLASALKKRAGSAEGQEAVLKAHAKVLEAAAAQAGVDVVREAATAQFDAMLELLPEAEHHAVERTRTGTVNMAVMRMVTAGHRSFIASDAPTVLKALKVPVYAVWGEADSKLPPELHASGARKALTGNKAAEVEVLAAVNHMLQPTGGTKTPDDYAAIAMTVDEGLMSKLKAWILAR